ncbi:MAG: Flp pilus assembly protein RcpC/CpaB [Chloroflexota bacterium]|jgi:Flp pilus assembly protein CpaB
MEMEYHDDSRKSRLIIILGVILAVVAGGGAFLLVSQAQQQASVADVPKAQVVVATRVIPSRKAIELADLAVKEVPADLAAAGAVADPNELVARITAVSILEGQIVTTNMLASTDVGGQFSILKPEETVAPDSPYWRAVTITVPDDRAVAGLVTAGMTVDVFATSMVNLSTEEEAAPAPVPTPSFMPDNATKVIFQNIEILAKVGTFYVVRVPIGVAEEIEHLQATGGVMFSMALRPSEDTRVVDVTNLGATTNLLIQRYGLPIPVQLALSDGTYTGNPVPFPIPTRAPTPSPSGSVAPSPTPAP